MVHLVLIKFVLILKVLLYEVSFSLSMRQGAITKRMTAIEEMAGMDVLCSDKTGTLTLNKLTVDKNLIEVGDFLPLGVMLLKYIPLKFQ